MRRISAIFLVFLSGVFAQDPAEQFTKAPPDIDEALRARIREFYQAHVDGKFREADKLVAPDSKDHFFAAEKRQYRSFDIVKIDYSENFTKAKAVVACETEFAAFGNRFPVKMPLPSLWKIENGDWYWYTIPTNEVQSPIGVMRPGPMPKESEASALGVRAPPISVLREKVRIDRKQIRLKADEPGAEEIKVSNQLAGSIRLKLEMIDFPGLEVKLNREQLDPNETGVISFRYRPGEKVERREITVRLYVDPLGDLIPIIVTLE